MGRGRGEGGALFCRTLNSPSTRSIFISMPARRPSDGPSLSHPGLYLIKPFRSDPCLWPETGGFRLVWGVPSDLAQMVRCHGLCVLYRRYSVAPLAKWPSFPWGCRDRLGSPPGSAPACRLCFLFYLLFLLLLLLLFSSTLLPGDGYYSCAKVSSSYRPCTRGDDPVSDSG